MQRDYPTLKRLSLDKGFWRPKVDADLSATLDQVTLPKTGRRTVAERTDDFVAARKPHPAIESAITMLEHQGQQRVLSFGRERFSRMVGISVIAANLTRVGRHIREAERDRRKRQQRAA